MEQRLLRNSERKAYRRCRQKWEWAYRDCLTTTRPKGALVFGTLIHEALAEYYPPGRQRGPHPAEAFLKLHDQAVERDIVQWDDNGEKHSMRDLGYDMLCHYIDFWGNDGHIEVIAPEQAFEMPVYLKDGRFLTTLVGRFDLVWRNLWDDTVWLTDHKTAKSIKTAHLQLDDQAGGYYLAATEVLRSQGLIDQDEELAGIMYNFLRKAVRDERPQDERGRYLNKDGSVSKSQPPAYFLRHPVYRSASDNREQLRRLRKEAFEINKVRDGELPIYKNPTMDCDWDCEFFDMCAMHERGADWQELRDQMYMAGNPYESYLQDDALTRIHQEG